MRNEQELQAGAFFCKILEFFLCLTSIAYLCPKKINSLLNSLSGVEKMVSLFTAHPWHYADPGHILFYLAVTCLFPTKEVLN